MREAVLTATVILAVAVSSALAHPGPRIWVNVENGKVTTYAGPYPPTLPSNYHLSQVFTQPLIDEGEDIWDTDFPGYQEVPGGQIPAVTTFRYNIMGPLLWYNTGDAPHCPFFEPVQQHFANSPPIPQMGVTNESFLTQYTATGFVSGDAAYAFNGSAGDHNHLTYMLLGDGLHAGGGADGIYALPLQLTASGYAPSDTFYLLLSKNATAADITTAAGIILAPRLAPDLDCDGDVDADDLVLLRACRTGPSVPAPAPAPGLEYCVRTDFDSDGDVDQDDFGRWQRCFSGAGIPANSVCNH